MGEGVSQYDKKLGEIWEHIEKIRNKSLRNFLIAYLYLWGTWRDTWGTLPKPPEGEDIVATLFSVDNIFHVLKVEIEGIGVLPRISKRTAYDYHHGLLALTKISDLFDISLYSGRG